MKNLKNQLSLKNNILKITIALLVIVSVLCCLSFLDLGKKPVSAQIEITDASIEENYFINETVKFPQEISAKYDGKDCTFTNGVIIFPDKVSYKLDEMILNQYGEYTLIYYYKAGNTLVEAKKTFVVTDYLYNLSEQNGSITTVTKASQSGKELISNSDNVMLNKEDGLIVRLGEGNTFEYNLSLDLNNVDDNGLCDIATIDYRLTDFVKNPNYKDGDNAWTKRNAEGESAEYCVIKLTDIYDETNYVELWFFYNGIYNNPNYHGGSDASFYRSTFTAMAVGQKRTGSYITTPDAKDWATGGVKIIDVNGQNYATYIGVDAYLQRMGTFIGHMRADHKPYTWKYDAVNSRVYVETDGVLYFVTELSNTKLYGDQAFKGFSENKVKLSIRMEDYLSDSYGRIDVTSIGTHSGKELVDNYGKASGEDVVGKPKIELPLNLTDEYGVYAPIGSYFELPKPTIYGGNSKDYSVNVYLNYGSPSQLNIPVTDNKFLVSSALLYTVKYTAVNQSGTKGETILNVNGVHKTDAISVDLDLSNSTLRAGVRFELPTYKVETINDESKLKYEIFAVSENQRVKITNNSFIPFEMGKFEIVFKCQDNVYSVEKRFEIQAQKSDAVFFDGEISLPKYFIQNATYSFDEMSAYAFTDKGAVRTDYITEISFDSEDNFVKVNDINKVKITGSKYAIVRYTCQNKSNPEVKSVLVSDKIQIVNVYHDEKTLAPENYFIHDNFNVLPYDKVNNPKTEVKFDSKLTSGTNTLKFINAMNINDISLRLKTTDNANYKQLRIVLKDYYDENTEFFFSIVDVNGTSCIVNVNDEKQMILETSFAGGAIKKIDYSLVTRTLSVDKSSTSIDLSKYFSSELVYLEIELVDIFGAASVVVDQMNLQNFRHNGRDNVGPSISIKDFNSEFETGSIVTLPKPVVTDIFSSILKGNVKVTVQKDEKFIVATDGTTLNNVNAFKDYQFEITEFGSYRITFTATDGKNSTSEFVIVSNFDNEAPTIKLLGDYKKGIKTKVGEIINLEFEVNDNLTNAENISLCYMIREKSSNAIVSYAQNGFSVKIKGEYEIIIYASDESGNFAYESIDLIVG